MKFSLLDAPRETLNFCKANLFEWWNRLLETVTWRFVFFRLCCVARTVRVCTGCVRTSVSQNASFLSSHRERSGTGFVIWAWNGCLGTPPTNVFVHSYSVISPAETLTAPYLEPPGWVLEIFFVNAARAFNETTVPASYLTILVQVGAVLNEILLY